MSEPRWQDRVAAVELGWTVLSVGVSGAGDSLRDADIFRDMVEQERFGPRAPITGTRISVDADPVSSVAFSETERGP